MSKSSADDALAALEKELGGLSVAQLKAYLRDRGVPTDDCFEKADLLARARSMAEAGYACIEG